MNLYELDANYKQLENMIDDDADNTAIFDTLESIQEDMTTKFENIEKWRRNMQGNIAAIKTEEDRLKQKRQSLESKCESLKHYLQSFMIDTGKKKLKAGIFNFSIQKNPISVNVLDMNKIPRQYLILQEPKVDKTAIKAAWKNDEDVPGVERVQTEGLRVR